MSNEASLKEYRVRIQKVIEYINAHLADELPLEVLAGAACFSAFHFHRIFSLLVGETPAEFVNRLRLERAANILLFAPSITITEVAFECGFSSSATFSRSFKKYFKTSATHWRHDSKIRKATASGRPYIDSVTSIQHAPIDRHKSVNITIRRRPPFHIAYAASLHGYGHEQIGATWRTICGWAGANGFFGRETKMIGISFDNPDITPKDKCRYYACLTVPEEIATPPGIGVMDLPGGLYAVKHFEGMEEGITGAYTDLYNLWLPDSGYLPANSPCYELYTSTPDQNASGHFVMDICLPITPI
jgi:AraC family transcriptional regulator